MRLLPIGSVIEVNERKFCIVGYTSMSKEDKTKCGYYVVPYPIGYISVEKTFFIPVTLPAKVLAYGYQSEASKSALDLLGMYFDSAKVIRPDKIHLVTDAYKQVLDSFKKEEQQ